MFVLNIKQNIVVSVRWCVNEIRAILCKGVRKAFFNKNIFESISARNKGLSFVDTGRESILGRGKNRGKDPEVGSCSSHLRKSKTSGLMDNQGEIDNKLGPRQGIGYAL